MDQKLQQFVYYLFNQNVYIYYYVLHQNTQ